MSKLCLFLVSFLTLLILAPHEADAVSCMMKEGEFSSCVKQNFLGCKSIVEEDDAYSIEAIDNCPKENVFKSCNIEDLVDFVLYTPDSPDSDEFAEAKEGFESICHDLKSVSNDLKSASNDLKSVLNEPVVKALGEILDKFLE